MTGRPKSTDQSRGLSPAVTQRSQPRLLQIKADEVVSCQACNSQLMEDLEAENTAKWLRKAQPATRQPTHVFSFGINVNQVSLAIRLTSSRQRREGLTACLELGREALTSKFPPPRSNRPTALWGRSVFLLDRYGFVLSSFVYRHKKTTKLRATA